jgi:hypothetical protein
MMNDELDSVYREAVKGFARVLYIATGETSEIAASPLREACELLAKQVVQLLNEDYSRMWSTG